MRYTIPQAIDKLDEYFGSDTKDAFYDAWQTLKAAVLATTPNTGSPKLPPCMPCSPGSFDRVLLKKGYNYCPYCGRQLRAGA